MKRVFWTARMSCRSPRVLRADEHAVSDAIGNILMIGITIAISGGLALTVTSMLKPDPYYGAEVGAELADQDSLWGTGNERVTVKLLWGEPLEKKWTKIYITAGGLRDEYSDADLDQGFSDGKLTLGESWYVDKTIAAGQEVMVEVVAERGDASKLLSSSTFRSEGFSCTTDTAAPTAQSWTQSPSDVDNETSGDVTVTVTMTDDCSGVDNGFDPTLYYRMQDGTSPAYTSAGAMTRVGMGRWTGTVPDQTWSNQTGNTLQYYVSGTRDLRSNSGDTSARADPIQGTVLTYTYVNGNTLNNGTIANFTNAQSAADSTAKATLTEGSQTSTIVYEQYATSVISYENEVNSPHKTLLEPDGQHTITENKDKKHKVGAYQGRSGAITKVEVGYTGYYVAEAGFNENPNAQEVEIKYFIDGSDGSTRPRFNVYNTTTTVYTDVTADEVSWSWTDIESGQIEVKSKTQDNKVDLYTDSTWFRITADGTGYTMNIEMDFLSVPAAIQYDLELNYWVQGSENFDVEVWNGTAWNQRGATLGDPSWTTWSYRLTDNEYNGGVPKLRFMDEDPLAGTSSKLHLDYVRVVSS